MPILALHRVTRMGIIPTNDYNTRASNLLHIRTHIRSQSRIRKTARSIRTISP